jgi:hypothetical protein
MFFLYSKEINSYVCRNSFWFFYFRKLIKVLHDMIFKELIEIENNVLIFEEYIYR